jgi:hypothetical protein
MALPLPVVARVSEVWPRLSGLASGLALAVRSVGLVEVSRP